MRLPGASPHQRRATVSLSPDGWGHPTK